MMKWIWKALLYIFSICVVIIIYTANLFLLCRDFPDDPSQLLFSDIDDVCTTVFIIIASSVVLLFLKLLLLIMNIIMHRTSWHAQFYYRRGLPMWTLCLMRPLYGIRQQLIQRILYTLLSPYIPTKVTYLPVSSPQLTASHVETPIE